MFLLVPSDYHCLPVLTICRDSQSSRSWNFQNLHVWWQLDLLEVFQHISPLFWKASAFLSNWRFSLCGSLDSLISSQQWWSMLPVCCLDILSHLNETALILQINVWYLIIFNQSFVCVAYVYMSEDLCRCMCDCRCCLMYLSTSINSLVVMLLFYVPVSGSQSVCVSLFSMCGQTMTLEPRRQIVVQNLPSQGLPQPKAILLALKAQTHTHKSTHYTTHMHAYSQCHHPSYCNY